MNEIEVPPAQIFILDNQQILLDYIDGIPCLATRPNEYATWSRKVWPV